MKNFIKTIVYFLVTCVFGITELKSQEQKINFKHYTVNDGLSQNTVLSLLEDKYGFIWIGTEDGLNKFDGYEFKIYRNNTNDPRSISNNQINDLQEDANGDIWIATAKGLNLFDRKTESFKRIFYNSSKTEGVSDYITTLFQEKQGVLWIGSLEDLKRFDPQTQQFHTFRQRLHKENDSNRIISIYKDIDGILWIGFEKELRRFNPKTGKFIPLPSLLEKNTRLRKSFVRTIKRDKQGRIWFGTEYGGIFIYDAESQSLRNLKHFSGDNNSLPSNIIRNIHMKGSKEVWIGTREGLGILDIDKNIVSTYANNIYNSKSISNNIIRSILEDRSGNIWIGTYAGGLNLMTSENNVFSRLGQKMGDLKGLNQNVISAIAADKDNSVWIGLENGGLNHVDKTHTYFKSYNLTEPNNNSSYNTAKSLLKDGSKMWIGTLSGLWCLNTLSNKLDFINIPENKGIYSIQKTDKGIWLATNGAGLLLLTSDGKVKKFKHETTNLSSICSNSINKILVNEKGHLWVATGRGLDYFDGVKFKHYQNDFRKSKSLGYNIINTIFIDSKKRVWIGTKGGGLDIFDEEKQQFYHITTNDGLSNDVVQDIQEDRMGNLWISSNKGLSRISFKTLSFPLKRNYYSIINYYFEDGLQSNQFLQNCGNINENGLLYFGGTNGITFFDPSRIKTNLHKPTVVFTDFLIRNKSVSISDSDSPLKTVVNETNELILENDQAYITIKFAGLDFVNPSKNQYMYKLEGLQSDEDWHLTKNQRTASYTNLDAGNYIFKVKAANNDGIWNDLPKTIKIKVLPPWWKSWWAFLSYALAISWLLYLYYYFSLKTVKLKNDLHFEHLIHEKDQELYKMKLNFFINISHEIKTPLTLIMAPLEKLIKESEGNRKIMSQLSLMMRNGERLIRLINQLLDFKKFESGNMGLQTAEGNIVRFVKEVAFAFQPYAKQLNITLKVDANQKSIRLWFDRDKFEKILYNLLSNAFKFTKPGGKVVVKVTEQKEVSTKGDGYVLMQVIDNGIGISEEHIDKIFDQFTHYTQEGKNTDGTGIGLAFTKGLVELHYGEIMVESKEATKDTNGLTSFSVKIPMGFSHLKENEKIANYISSENIEGYYDLNTALNPSTDADLRRLRVISQNQGEKPLLLIVEDNQEVLDFLVSYFEGDFDVRKAINGREGLEFALQLIPDLIVSDVMMPEISGTELCGILKNDERTSHIPVILLTARAPLINRIEGLERGADDYITKPFSIQVLETRIWNLLDIRQKLRERYKKEVTLQPTNISITSSDEAFLNKVMGFIENNISRPDLSVEQLGKEMFMTKTTLYRKIKALTNQTTVEFIRTVRLMRAAQLLDSKKYNINEIAYMVGFIDINYFRRCFKKEFKKNPAEYVVKKS